MDNHRKDYRKEPGNFMMTAIVIGFMLLCVALGFHLIAYYP